MKKILITILLLIGLVASSCQAQAAELQGRASYYSRSGCLGCDFAFIMANGEAFTDKGLTIALTPETVKKYKLLNDYVGIINLANNKSVIARVTDTGGFGKYNRIADLGIAVKDALDCSGMCKIVIVF